MPWHGHAAVDLLLVLLNLFGIVISWVVQAVCVHKNERKSCGYVASINYKPQDNIYKLENVEHCGGEPEQAATMATCT